MVYCYPLRGIAQLVACLVRDQEASGSNPDTPTKKGLVKASPFFSYIRLRRVLLLRSDIRFASVSGEYDIIVRDVTVRGSNKSLLRKQKYHAERSMAYHEKSLLLVSSNIDTKSSTRLWSTQAQNPQS